MNIEKGLLRFSIKSKEWGKTKILRPLPQPDEPWGVLACLKETPWGDLISVVSGDSLSHALHGHVTPFMNELGREPSASLRLVPTTHRTCSLSKSCITYEAAICHPCSKLPACYEPPFLETAEQRSAAHAVVLAWKEGRYVIVVGEGEFNL